MSFNHLFSGIKDILKEHTQDIINQVVQNITEKIEQKKQLVELTPKASAIAALSKENQQYFEDLIDKAIAKKFK